MAYRWTICGVAALALGVGGCAATPKVRVQKADTEPACQTFDWLPASKDAASLTEQRVRSAALAQLEAKGYTHSTDKPDCRITYVLSLSEQPKPRPSVGVGAGGGSRGVHGGIGVSLPVGRRGGQTGTVTLDVVDVASNAQIWSGSLDASFASKQLSEEEAQAVVRRILAEFPDREAPTR